MYRKKTVADKKWRVRTGNGVPVPWAAIPDNKKYNVNILYLGTCQSISGDRTAFPGKLHRDRNNNNNIIQRVFYEEVTTHNHSRITILHKDDVLLLFIIVKKPLVMAA